MGLDAVVYRGARNVAEALGNDHFDVEPQTGEVMAKPGVGSSIPHALITAIDRRLGNIGHIDWLREQLEPILSDQDSVILKDIIYSGSHCGDAIRPDKFSKLRIELELLKKRPIHEDVHSFVVALEELVQAGEAEGNPIVFT